MKTHRAGWTLCVVGVGFLAGCQADFAADVTNKTPQPLSARLFSKGDSSATLEVAKRLGPGDRAFLGPIRNNKNKGAFVVFDTLGNPGRPTTLDLPPNTTAYFDVLQDSDKTSGPLIVIPK